jgi:hypothetical protein
MLTLYHPHDNTQEFSRPRYSSLVLPTIEGTRAQKILKGLVGLMEGLAGEKECAKPKSLRV